MLASCDHSIHAYGTFGTWSSLLAGGDVIVSTGNNADANTEVNGIKGNKIVKKSHWLSH